LLLNHLRVGDRLVVVLVKKKKEGWRFCTIAKLRE